MVYYSVLVHPFFQYRVETLDKTGAVYYNTCKKHPESTYVGETERVLRERMYEHRIIDHKTAKRYASLSYNEEEEEEKEEQQTKRSTRLKKKVDYKAIQSGTDQQLTLGNTEFSAHVASDRHNKDDLQFKLITTDDDWFQRGVKEAIAIRQLKPTLNQDDGRFHLSAMYNKFLHSSDTVDKFRKELQEATANHEN